MQLMSLKIHISTWTYYCFVINCLS